MAPANQVAPATLPGNFSQWDAPAATGSGPPATLPADFSKWDEPAPPTSGLIPGIGKVPQPPSLTQGGTAGERLGAQAIQGFHGAEKGLMKTAQNIHDSNYALAPKNTPFAQPKPFADADLQTHTPDEQAGKFVEGLAEMAAPIGEVKAVPTAAKGLAGRILPSGSKTLAGAGTSLPEALKSLLPSAERAGGQLSAMGKKFAGEPVHLLNSAPELGRAEQLSRAGGGSLGPVRNLITRAKQPGAMDFPDTRDFYSNISAMSGDAKRAMAPALKRQVGNVRQALNADLVSTANRAQPATEIGYRGQPLNAGGPAYQSAMDEYRHAKQLEGAKDFVTKKLIPGGLLGVAGKYGYDKLRGH